MTTCVLINGTETHKAYNVNCKTKSEMSDTSTFAGGGQTEVGRKMTCTMVTDTMPKRMGIYEMKCKDEACSCKRFQVLQVQKQGARFLVSGTKLSDEGL